jgi:hypothetical protein
MQKKSFTAGHEEVLDTLRVPHASSVSITYLGAASRPPFPPARDATSENWFLHAKLINALREIGYEGSVVPC